MIVPPCIMSVYFLAFIPIPHDGLTAHIALLCRRFTEATHNQAIEASLLGQTRERSSSQRNNGMHSGHRVGRVAEFARTTTMLLLAPRLP